MQLTDYLARLELPTIEATAANRLASEIQAETDHETQPEYRYPVPELGEAGSCSLLGTLADTPYDLAPILGGNTADNDRLLSSLQALTRRAAAQLSIDWLGCYLRTVNLQGEPVLVKLAYTGEPSRAEFPLNDGFAALSNNVQVALSGEPRLINDVAEHLAQGGAYYTCDLNVQSEACLPLWGEAQDGQEDVIGIVDAESFEPHFFAPDKLTLLADYCRQAQQLLRDHQV